ncbi:lactonase family protein [Agromyces soli]
MAEESTGFWIGGNTAGWLGAPAAGVRSLEVAADGSWRLGPVVDVGSNPMYLAWNGPVLAVAHEVSPGAVSTWRLDPSDPHGLQPVSPADAADGDPCHLAFDPSGRWVLAANYSGGSITSHPSGADPDGSTEAVAAATTAATAAPAWRRAAFSGTGPDASRQSSSHLHQAVVDADRGRVLGPDLGADRIRLVEVDARTGALRDAGSIALHPGAGPRHLVIRGGLALVANELDRTVSIIDLETDAELAWAPVAPGVASRGLGLSAIRITRGGIVLVGDRDADALAALRFDAETRTLEPLASVPTGGRHPRDLELTHDERHALVADLASGSIAVVALDAEGAPLRVVDTIVTEAPACLARVPR